MPAEWSAVQTFAVDVASGRLSHLGCEIPTGSVSPCHLALMGGGGQQQMALLVAHFAGGAVSMLSIDTDTGAVAACRAVQPMGVPWWEESTASPGTHTHADPAYAAGHHAHCTAVEPTHGLFALVADYGRSMLFVLDISSEKQLALAAVPPFACGAGTGPRQLAFHPSGRLLFVVHADAGMLQSFRFDPTSGALQPLSEVSTTPIGGASDLAVSADGSIVYVGNIKEATTVTTVAVDEKDGGLHVIGTPLDVGCSADTLSLTHEGEWLVVASTSGNRVLVLRIGGEGSDHSREPRMTGNEVSGIEAPSCVAFLLPNSSYSAEPIRGSSL